jgi:SAM-dependent methyltransferase
MKFLIESMTKFKNFVRLFGNFDPGQMINCNFCGRNFLRLTPDHSEFLGCPGCGAVARERTVYQALLHELDRPEAIVSRNPHLAGLRLLEFSPRNYRIRLPIYRSTFAEYRASDFDLSAHRGDIKVDLTRPTDIEPIAGSFDVVICAHVLEHVLDYRTAIFHLAKLIKPGGLVLLQVPVLESRYTNITWDEFHGDNTRVYHRFSFDLAGELENAFTEVKIFVGQLKFEITSPEIHPQKYDFIRQGKVPYEEFGPERMRRRGLGSPDLCEVFVLKNHLCRPIEELAF